MHFKSTWHTTNSVPSESLIMIQASALPDMSHVIAVTGNRLNCLVDIYIYIYIYTYRMSQEECEILRECVPYVTLYRYNPKHLYPKLNGYGDNGQRKMWTSCISAFYTPTAVSRATPPSGHMTACGAYVR